MALFDSLKEKLLSSEIKKSWVYLLYIYWILPVLLFVLAWALRDTGMGSTFGALFHNYGLFVACPIPSASLTGIFGLVLGLVFLFKAFRRRDWADFGICVALLLLTAAYFYFGLNYRLLPFIAI